MTTLADDNTPYKLFVEQSSTPSNPAAGKQKLYIRTSDNKLCRVNSAGSVTVVEGTSTGGYAEGTSFPGSPSTNDKFYRTDRNLLYFYDGTRWLTTTLYEHDLGSFYNASAALQVYTPVWAQDYDVYFVNLYATMYTVSGLSGTAYWTLQLNSYDGASSASVASVTNQSGTNAIHERKKATINALLGTAKDALELSLVKTSTPGNFYGGAMVTYRLVG